jgi:thiopeptide-type bacteriocin biosynthesis protein
MPNPAPAPLLYEPLDFLLVRAPALPLDVYLDLGLGSSALAARNGEAGRSLAPDDSGVRRALAVGSLSLFDELERSTAASRDAADLQRKLLRFLIRMSTRPTPFGLFAGVALGRWGSTTDLSLAAGTPRIRTRPDAGWLIRLALAEEARPAVRADLRLVANPSVSLRAGRVCLEQRAPTLEPDTPAVSLRATGPVRRALEAARRPVARRVLAETLVRETPGATPEKVEKLLDQLCHQTVLLTDLRPPLTAADPARAVARRLAEVPAARDAATQLGAILDAAAAWDALPAEGAAEAYRDLVARANAAAGRPAAEGSTPFQVDMALPLAGRQVARAVADEAARAAGLLLRLTPVPAGPPYLTAYRRAFESRYGPGRLVPLTELLDPHTGLGPPWQYGGPAAPAVEPARAAARTQALLEIATGALRDRTAEIELDAEMLARLETGSPRPDHVPPSLELYLSVAARSAADVDRGQFLVVVGPNLGASAAGRNLGRFADLLGPEARVALERAARAEEARASGRLWAELVYMPRQPRLANVTVRPAVRGYEIPVAVAPGVPDPCVIPLGELAIGVRDGRLFVHWTVVGAEVAVCAGHMLNPRNAPAVCQFLSEVGRDGQAQLGAFDWGPASGFPALPRVQSGRVVLRPAQWRVGPREVPPGTAEAFRAALGRWRSRWDVPRHVYLGPGDQRLLLDLDDPRQADELRTTLRRGSAVILQEVLPALDEVWTEGPSGRYVVEFVVPLVLRPAPAPAQAGARVPAAATAPAPAALDSAPKLPAAPVPVPLPVPAAVRLRPPGSEWLYAKLYGARDLEDDLIAGPLRDFAEGVLADGAAEAWFYVRYSDPDPHVRLRFRGDPGRLTGRVLPALCAWGAGLMADGTCQKLAFDTYDREVERFGGPDGAAAAEAVFAADSRACAELLGLCLGGVLAGDRTTLAVLTIDDLLSALGATGDGRLSWYRPQAADRRASGDDYRRLKGLLRPLLADPQRLAAAPGGAALAGVLSTRREALAQAADRLAALARLGTLGQPLPALYRAFVHLHCNRLAGTDRSTESTALGLLLRVRDGLARAPLR